MAIYIKPIPDQWYFNARKNQKFQVITTDHQDVHIQYPDGEIDSIWIEDWRSLDLQMIQPPDKDQTDPAELGSDFE